MSEEKVLKIQDVENNREIRIVNPTFYGPAIPTQDTSYTETGCLIDLNDGASPIQPIFTYPSKPTDKHAIAMWDTINEFENNAWQAKNKGMVTGWDLIDKGFDGGLFPGFIIIAGDSNLGKTAFLSQMAFQVSQLNKDAYVMDFSLDDAMPDKLSRVAASAGGVIINAVKTPLNYTNYPLMLIRRKNALMQIRNSVDNYRIYDATFSTYVEKIEEEIEKMLIYFKANNINKQLVVCIDNFHDLNTMNNPNLHDKEKYDFLAQWCSDIAIKHNIILVCTAELKKINGSRRPILDDMRESVKIKYEAKAVLLVYNEVHYKTNASDIYWQKPNDPNKKPIFEAHFAKNKFGSYKGRVFFQFHPEMALMKECDPILQKSFSSLLFN